MARPRRQDGSWVFAEAEMDRATFQNALRERFYPLLRAEGFQGSGNTLRRMNGAVLHVFNFQGSSGGGRCYLNLGVHLSFLPAAGENEPDLAKLKEYECAFGKRLPPPDGFGWRYGNDAVEMNASIEGICECWSTYGRSYFAQYSTYPESFVSLLDGLDPSTTPPHHLLTLARIASHLGDTARASSLAAEGIRRCSHRATALLEELKEFASVGET